MKFFLVKKRSLLAFLMLIIVFIAAVTANAYAGAADVWLNKVQRKLPIYCVDTQENKVAISFDASWGAEKTLKILEIVEAHDIRATFFTVGFWAERYSDKLKTLSDSGRFEIGTHSNTHPDLAKLSADKIKLELNTSINIIENIVGKKVELFRPPFGSYNNTLLNVTDELGLYTIQWDVDSLDWKKTTASEIAARVLKKTQKGSIILMHNDGEFTVDALPLIIEGVKNKGLKFVTIGELIYRENYTINHAGKQVRA